MACLGPCYVLTQSTSNFLDDRSDGISGFNRLQSLSTTKLAVKNHSTRICAAAATVVSDRPVSSLQISCSSSIEFDADLVVADKIVNDDNEFYNSTIESPNVTEKLEEWIQGSVTEIVKNIRQAPLLLQIYANGEVKTEKAVKAKSWPNVISSRSTSSPEGIILVEEIGENRDEESKREFKENGGTRAFGVLIQGKIKGRDESDECKSACYLLKTSSVNGGGLGFGCSHYCLMKVKSFRESAASQLNGCWMV